MMKLMKKMTGEDVQWTPSDDEFEHPKQFSEKELLLKPIEKWTDKEMFEIQKKIENKEMSRKLVAKFMRKMSGEDVQWSPSDDENEHPKSQPFSAKYLLQKPFKKWTPDEISQLKIKMKNKEIPKKVLIKLMNKMKGKKVKWSPRMMKMNIQILNRSVQKPFCKNLSHNGNPRKFLS